MRILQPFPKFPLENRVRRGYVLDLDMHCNPPIDPPREVTEGWVASNRLKGLPLCLEHDMIDFPEENHEPIGEILDSKIVKGRVMVHFALRDDLEKCKEVSKMIDDGLMCELSLAHRVKNNEYMPVEISLCERAGRERAYLASGDKVDDALFVAGSGFVVPGDAAAVAEKETKELPAETKTSAAPSTEPAGDANAQVKPTDASSVPQSDASSADAPRAEERKTVAPPETGTVAQAGAPKEEASTLPGATKGPQADTAVTGSAERAEPAGASIPSAESLKDVIKEAVREALGEVKDTKASAAGAGVPMDIEAPVPETQQPAKETKSDTVAPMDVDSSSGKTSVCDPVVKTDSKTSVAAMASQEAAPALNQQATEQTSAPLQQQQQEVPVQQQQQQQQVPRPDGAVIREHVGTTNWTSPFFPQQPGAGQDAAAPAKMDPQPTAPQAAAQDASLTPKPSTDSIICDTAKALLEQHKDSTPAFNALMALLDAKDVMTASRIIQDLASRPAKMARSSQEQPAQAQPQEVGVAASATRRPAMQPQQQQTPVQLGYSSGRGPAPIPSSADQSQEGFLVVASDMNPRADVVQKIRASAGSVFLQQPTHFKNAHFNQYADENWERQRRRIAHGVGEGLAFARSSGATSGFVASARDPNITRCAKAGTSFIIPCLTDDTGRLPNDMFECVAKTIEFVARTTPAGASAWEVRASVTESINDQGKRSRVL